MTKVVILASFAILLRFPILAQIGEADSVRTLDEITIQAYEYNRPLNEVPVAVGMVNTKDFDRFNNTSILPALNSIPGVRMEERSPGSYRLSVRGSTLRSPFGVRNIKVYWNDLPFTDPGGNTYLNLLDLSSIQQAEVIKGPGASLYGAGTGGVLLLKSPKPTYNQQEIQLSTVAGSFGINRFNIGWQNSTEKANSTIQYAHQQADGYREQSKMRRDLLLAQSNFSVTEKRVISVNLLYSDLLYQTPGALTKIQYDTLPKQARPGALDKKATIYNKTFYSSISQEYAINKNWSNRSGAYTTFTEFNNPTIRNYERRTEQSYGARSITKFSSEKFKVDFGGEFQHGFSPIRTYDNNKGNTGNLQTDDEIVSTSALIFSQVDWVMPKDFFLTVGASYNFYMVDFSRFSTSPPTNENRNFTPVFSPRVALLKKVTSTVSIYGSYSQGFSPPTVPELYPSTAVFDKTLAPEKGNNYELGLKGNLFNKSIQFGLTAYTFKLKQAIASRRDTTIAGDPEYFVNAGNTLQKGLELNISWQPLLPANSVLKDLRLWSSVTLNNYRFQNYTKDNVILSGNKLTGSPAKMIVLGLDISLLAGFYSNVTFNYTDSIPLNDENTAFANSYALLGARLGYRFVISNSLPLDFFGGVDNALNAIYSLGNDLNAVSGRYYNAAPTRNFYVGLKCNLILKKNK